MALGSRDIRKRAEKVMKAFLKRTICVLFAFSMLLGTVCAQAANETITPQEALEDIAAYCYDAVTEPGYGSEWFLACFAISGCSIPDSYRNTYYQALCAKLKACGGVLDTRKYTEYSRVVLALTALGYNPADVAGYDLTLPLADFEGTVRQGVNGAVFALLALDSGNYRIPAAGTGKTQATRARYVVYLLERQLSDGGFSASGKTADPDMTAMALQALAKYAGQADVDAAIARGLAYLSGAQHADGGFDNWGTENAESCAQVLLALCELKISPDDSRFVKNGVTVTDALLAYRLEDGSFRHTRDGKTDMLATRQAYMALASLQRVQAGKTPFYTLAGSTAFRDMAGHANETAVRALAREGILSGRGDGTFDPDATMTRAEFAAMIVRAIGADMVKVPCFTDVSQDAWYAAYVGAAYQSGIVKGTSATRFSPDATITDSEAEVMVARAARYLKLQPTTAEEWRASTVCITRAETAQLLYDLLAQAGRIG